MEQSIFQVLIDYGSLGIMCGFLFWLHIQNQKRNDLLSDRFQEQLEKMRLASKEDEEKIRDRFAVVVEKYDTERSIFFEERTQIRSNLSTQIKSLQQQANQNENKLDNLMIVVDNLFQAQKAIQDEQRLKELARKARAGEAK